MKSFIFLLFTFFVFSTTGISQTKDRLPCVDKTFSIVVHIVKDSLKGTIVTEPGILALIPALNADFAPICVSFSVCEFKYIDNFAYDKIARDADKGRDFKEMQHQYNLKNRINLYFVQNITDVAACGFASLGGINYLDSLGIVIKKSCLNARTLSHEMGHYFGLKHTFDTESGAELANGSNCKTAGDEICDTPADPFVEGDDPAKYVDATCKFISMKKDANGQYYDPLVGNIMSYYPCSCGFTDEQYIKMATVYLSKTGIW